jgi:hypothetical protein
MEIAGIPSNIWIPAVTAIVGILVGAVAKGYFDYAMQQRSQEHERATRQEERVLALRDKNSEFQLSTLLALQKQLVELSSATYAAHIELRVGSIVDGGPRPELDERRHDSSLELHRLGQGLQDDEARGLITKVTDASLDLSMAEFIGDREEMDIQGFERHASALQARIGELLRSLHADQTPGTGTSR